MNGSIVPQRKRHTPLVLVDTAGLCEEEWLSYRRQGVGGSDVAAILGISPFRTARDLYYDKQNIVPAESDEGNWVAKEMGHLLEDLVAKIFQKKTGLPIYQDKKMFYHPIYPFMIADLDYFVSLPDGSTAILEIKTTNYNARNHWWIEKQEIVPAYYEAQGRHYMAVMDVDRVFFCCLYGNNENEIIIREIKRDYFYEEEMIFLEENFWINHVQKQVPPSYTEDGDLIITSVRRHFGPADKNAPVVDLDSEMANNVICYLRLQEEKKNFEKNVKQIKDDLQRLKGMIVAEMGPSCTAVCEYSGINYTVSYNPVYEPTIQKSNLDRLKLQFPEIYDKFVTVSESRRFYVKAAATEVA